MLHSKSFIPTEFLPFFLLSPSELSHASTLKGNLDASISFAFLTDFMKGTLSSNPPTFLCFTHFHKSSAIPRLCQRTENSALISTQVSGCKGNIDLDEFNPM